MPLNTEMLSIQFRETTACKVDIVGPIIIFPKCLLHLLIAIYYNMYTTSIFNTILIMLVLKFGIVILLIFIYDFNQMIYCQSEAHDFNYIRDSDNLFFYRALFTKHLPISVSNRIRLFLW